MGEPGPLLTAARVVTPARTFGPGWLQVEGSRIGAVGAGEPDRPGDLDLPDATIVPGFVDTHVHGGGGASSDGGDHEAAARVVATHLPHGTTTMLASLVTDTVEGLTRSGDRLAELVDRLVEACDGHLWMVALAPELSGGRRCRTPPHHGRGGGRERARGRDVRPGAGGARRRRERRDPSVQRDAGAPPPRARSGRCASGAPRRVHGADRRRCPRAPGDVGLAAAAKPHHTVLVTDAMAATAAADGDYRLGRLDVTVRDGVASLASGAIAGSTATMAAAVRFAVRRAGLSLEDAVRAATATPAALHGLTRVGQLAPGCDADLVVLDDELKVVRVMRRGAWV